MAKSRPSVQKRRKEAAKREKAEAKAARKAARAAARERGEVEELNLEGLGFDADVKAGGAQPSTTENT
jgi:hypothetical protein